MVTDQQSPIFRAIADPTRRAILDRLRGGAKSVESIAEGFRISRPAVSRHLRVLGRAALVRAEKRGRQRLYRLQPEPLVEVDQWLTRYRVMYAAALLRLKEHVESHKGEPR
jgi:DNA-binding transcriptional ArsR family regulator